MQETSQNRQTELAWGSVSNLIDKISDIEETIDGGWDDLVEMVADIITEEGTVKSSSVIFSYVFNFMYNLLFRLESNPVKRDFNIISKTKIDGKDAFKIENYDYKSFKWAKENELAFKIDKDSLYILEDKLSEPQKKSFNNRCK